MKKSFVMMSLILSTAAFGDSSTAHPPSTEPSAAIASMPSTLPNPSPASALMTPAALLTDAEKKKLLSEFQKALANQRGALAHQEKAAIKELNSSQGIKKKKWLEDEKNARHQFFDQHMSGPDRRDYVQKFAKKKEEFDAALKSDYISAKKAWGEKGIALKASQKEQEAKFNASISQGIRPSAELWPAGN